MTQKYDLFGESSYLLILASLYTLLVVPYQDWFYTLFLALMPITSYLNNTYYNTTYQLADHVNIMCIGLSYLLIQEYYYPIGIIILFALVEFVTSKSIVKSNVIAVMFVVFFAFLRFSLLQVKIGIICLLVTTLSIYIRDPTKPSYKIYTTLWHTCCTILLIFVADTLK